MYGRATELAKVTQRKYNLAMAVVMGRDLDSVICDTEATAKECIHWLRQNQVAPMTFFPLDAVRAKVSLWIFCLDDISTIQEASMGAQQDTRTCGMGPGHNSLVPLAI